MSFDNIPTEFFEDSPEGANVYSEALKPLGESHKKQQATALDRAMDYPISNHMASPESTLFSSQEEFDLGFERLLAKYKSIVKLDQWQLFGSPFGFLRKKLLTNAYIASCKPPLNDSERIRSSRTTPDWELLINYYKNTGRSLKRILDVAGPGHLGINVLSHLPDSGGENVWITAQSVKEVGSHPAFYVDNKILSTHTNEYIGGNMYRRDVWDQVEGKFNFVSYTPMGPNDAMKPEEFPHEYSLMAHILNKVEKGGTILIQVPGLMDMNSPDPELDEIDPVTYRWMYDEFIRIVEAQGFKVISRAYDSMSVWLEKTSDANDSIQPEMFMSIVDVALGRVVLDS